MPHDLTQQLERLGWELISADMTAAESLIRDLNLHPITARILTSRNITDCETASRFLSPALSDVTDPFVIPDMDRAAARLARAVHEKQSIAIFGDYDVDGITASTLLADFLTAVGITPKILLPHRIQSGYGLNHEAIDHLVAEGVHLLVTVDNGTRAFDAAEHASARGLDLIITDHHELAETLPKAIAVVNPRRLEEASPLRSLSGCGVAFMLALATRRQLREQGWLSAPEPNLREQLDLVALGTIADVVPLTGVNRILTSFGLTELTRTRRSGLRALMNISATAPEEITPGTVAFRLAPRINAAGRIGDANDALHLLQAQSDTEAMRLARLLDECNRKRQHLEDEALVDAEAILANDPHLATTSGIVVHSKDWHVGVIGIVAARLAERNQRPTVVISQETTPARGSARSGGKLNLLAALEACADLLERHGGHAAAAGLSIAPERIPLFAQRFAAACAQLTPKGLPRLSLDAVVVGHDITPEFVQDLNRCEPFGMGNSEPLLAFLECQLLDARIVGTQHLKLRVRQGSTSFDAIGFGMASRFPGLTPRMAIAFTPQFNTWNGVTSVQLRLRDVVALD